MKITLKQARQAGACHDGYNRLVRFLQGKPFTGVDAERESYIRFKYEDEIPLLTVLESNGFNDALWATRCLVGRDRDLRLYAVACVREVQHLLKDERSLKALDVAEAFANGKATSEELRKAYEEAREAHAAAYYTASAAAHAAAYVAHAAAYVAAAAAYGAAAAAYGAAAAAYDAAAAYSNAKKTQENLFIRMCKGEAPWQTK